MGFTKLDRKAGLLRSGHTMQSVADACEVTVSTVSHVIAGRKVTGAAAVKVMDHIAALLNLPKGELFPEAFEKRSLEDRRLADRRAAQRRATVRRKKAA